MNRHLWIRSLGKKDCPAWPCPECRKGTVVLTQNSLTYKETTKSKRLHKDDSWDPTWIDFVFTAWGQCSNSACKQDFSIAGTGGVEPEFDDEGDWKWEEYFSPKICHPMPDMFEFSAKCPDSVRFELRAAFTLFWVHRAACASRIRVALEFLMDHLGVPKRRKDKGGKFYDLSLHGRVDAFAKKEPVVGQQLMALKWLGNSGSHDSEVSRDDLLDAFEIMEHALGEILEHRSARVVALAKKLTKKHAG